MELGNFKLFQYAKLRMQHAGQRQRVLAQNIANADTPNYRPSDVRELDFEKELRRTREPLQLAQTSSNHMGGTVPPEAQFRNEQERITFETSPDDNKVVLEEQMQKVGSTRGQYITALRLMNKHMQMISMALGRGGGGG